MPVINKNAKLILEVQTLLQLFFKSTFFLVIPDHYFLAWKKIKIARVNMYSPKSLVEIKISLKFEMLII